MSKRNKSALRTILCSALAITILLSSGGLLAGADQSLNADVFDYNGVVFGNFTGYQADVEGRLAVQRSASLGSANHGFDVGVNGSGIYQLEYVVVGELFDDSSIPSLVLGSSVSFYDDQHGYSVYGGPIAMKSSNQENYQSQPAAFGVNSVVYYEDAVIDVFFTSAKRTITNISTNLAKSYGLSITPNEMTSISADQLTQASQHGLSISGSVAVINIEETGSLNFGQISLADISVYDMILINSPASSISFTGGGIVYHGELVDTSEPIVYQNGDFLELANKLVWNFPNATSLSVQSYGLLGSVIAPYAEIDGYGGSINGQVFCGGLIQDNGLELHNFRLGMADRLRELGVNPDTDPDPSESSSESSGSSSSESSSESSGSSSSESSLESSGSSSSESSLESSGSGSSESSSESSSFSEPKSESSSSKSSSNPFKKGAPSGPSSSSFRGVSSDSASSGSVGGVKGGSTGNVNEIPNTGFTDTLRYAGVFGVLCIASARLVQLGKKEY